MILLNEQTKGTLKEYGLEGLSFSRVDSYLKIVGKCGKSIARVHHTTIPQNLTKETRKLLVGIYIRDFLEEKHKDLKRYMISRAKYLELSSTKESMREEFIKSLPEDITYHSRYGFADISTTLSAEREETIELRLVSDRVYINNITQEGFPLILQAYKRLKEVSKGYTQYLVELDTIETAMREIESNLNKCKA